ncbi:shikimate kinase [Aquihabitans daechungensis]|uniref:shikimate kinase n=1 Tax=Aquihabitans daechungensis TaxID=1052257 RepID=UPI003BA34989
MPETGPEVRATHVVLIGLMGSGKTTVGKKVAKLIGHRFVDADVELEARTGRSVASWFADGEPAFRAAEAELLEDLLADPDPLVLGAGGGVVVTESNRRRLEEHDVTAVYLHGTPEFLASRVQAKAHRPLLSDDPLAVMQAMYEQRDEWYREVADAVVEVRPHHEAGEKPKWRIAEQVAEELVALGVVAADEVSTTAARS